MSFLTQFLEKNKDIIQTVRFWLSLALVVAILFFSFCPVFTLNTMNVDDSIVHEIEEMTDGKVEYSAEVGVTPVKVVKSVILISDAIKLVADKDMTATERAEIEDKMNEEDTVECLILMSAIINSVDFEDGALVGVLMLLSVFALIIMAVILPIMAIVALIKALIGCFVKKNNRNAMASAMGKSASDFLVFAVMIMVFRSIVTGLNLGAGIVGVLVCALISIALNLISSRLVPYSKEAGKFLNVAQITALISVVGMLIATFATIGMNVVSRFGVQSQKYASAFGGEGIIIETYLLMFFYIFMIILISFAAPFIDRLTCSVKTSGRRRNSLVSLIIAAVIVIGIPTYMSTGDGGERFKLQLDTYTAYSEEAVDEAKEKIVDINVEFQEELSKAQSMSDAQSITERYTKQIKKQEYIIALNVGYKTEAEKLEALETILPELENEEDIESCKAEIKSIKTSENSYKVWAIIGFVLAIAAEIAYTVLSKAKFPNMTEAEKETIVCGNYNLEAPKAEEKAEAEAEAEPAAEEPAEETPSVE